MAGRLAVLTLTVAAIVLTVGAGDGAFAIDRVRAETGVDEAVDSLGVSGEGVIVAILDRGIDWESNDFRNDDGTTRIAYIFDLSDDSGADDPNNPYGQGTVYTQSQIDEALSGGAMLATRDAVGHGTTSTGIPAGNGRNSADRKYRGIAPNATIIAVKVVAGGDGSDEPHFYELSALPVAIDFVVHKARELSMPVVMLLNLGSIGGPTDGTSALSRKIDSTVGPDRPGVVFVTGTGDDGIPSKTQNRASGDVPNGGNLDLRFALDTGAGDLEVWYDEKEALAVSIRTPTETLDPFPASQFMAVGTGVRVYHYGGGDDFYGSANGKRMLFMRFDGAAGAGDYVVRLDHAVGTAGSGVRIDASLNTRFGEQGRFLDFVTPGSIWDGATAFRNIAPNSYVIRTRWTDIDGRARELFGEGDVGELWTGSSVGPTRDGRIGVDVSAPGDRIVTTYAPRSHYATYRSNLIEDGGGLYGMAGAVSAAAPVVTGIIALMLELDPTLDAASVKRILQETARADEFTGQTPNTLWGYGKVDAFEALMSVTQRISDTLPLVPGVSDSGQQGFVLIRNRSDEDGKVTIHGIDDAGKRFGPATLALAAGHTASFNSEDLEAGNADKGLEPGIGDGTGYWRLLLTTELDIEARGYIRTMDGFVTSMYELAREHERMKRRYVVPFFNPASNTKIVSRLRVANPNAVAVDVTLEAWDSRGEEAEEAIEFSVDAGAAVLLSSQQLEVGDADAFTGRLGDGTGKWRFEVTGGGQPLEVMSLLSTGSGHLTNLSR
ncbi:MAG: S8 family serine peptidase [Gammaproteobacteria bacterium]|nr:S8 family serine peptidase [Gammaproteobacteria bacterium]